MREDFYFALADVRARVAMTLASPLLPALAEEGRRKRAPKSAVIPCTANPTGYTWTVEIADEAVISVADDGIAQGDEQPLTGAGGLHAVLSCSARRTGLPPVTFVYARAFVGDGGGARVSAGVRPVGGCRPESQRWWLTTFTPGATDKWMGSMPSVQLPNE